MASATSQMSEEALRERWKAAVDASTALQCGALALPAGGGQRTSLVVPAGPEGLTARSCTVLRSDVARLILHSPKALFGGSAPLKVENPPGVARLASLVEIVAEAAERVEEGLLLAGLAGAPKGAAVLQALKACVDGEVDFAVTLVDPVALSCIDHPGASVEGYERSWEEEEDLGVPDGPGPAGATTPQVRVDFPWETEEDAGDAAVGDSAGGDDAGRVAAILARCKRVCVLTGAGVSAESGITPFRSYGDEKDDEAAESQGKKAAFWKRYDPSAFSYDRFLDSADARERAWHHNVEVYEQAAAAPTNPAHKIWGLLHERGQLLRLITQNIDGLHGRAGVPADRLIELHGSVMAPPACLECGAEYDAAAMTGRVTSKAQLAPVCDGKDLAAGGRKPVFPAGCRGNIKSGTVLFGEPLDGAAIACARDDVASCDALVVMGSSLIVEPANSLPGIALKRKVPVVIVNLGHTRFDEHATLHVAEPAGAFMGEVMNRLGSSDGAAAPHGASARDCAPAAVDALAHVGTRAAAFDELSVAIGLRQVALRGLAGR